MDYRKLGNTDLRVSLICLGTMTWGEQNTEEQAHTQMDFSLERGVNFFDTAEMYPVPPRAETQGRTESYIGTWFAKRKSRNKIILATKVTGKSEGFNYIRGSMTRLNREHITQALEASLKRLQTDYIDLYQLHWPDRDTNNFGKLAYEAPKQDNSIPLEETLEVLQDFVKQGKIRHVGLSNETPWGLMHALHLHRTQDLPRIVSIQNPYSLLNRTFEIGLSECSIRESCGLLAYSPLGFGVLTGKYMEEQKPANARLSLFSRFQRYQGAKAKEATERYVNIARRHNLVPAQMALAFVNQQPFVTSNIIGATTIEQLQTNIESIYVKLSEEVIKEINDVQTDIQNPCP